MEYTKKDKTATESYTLYEIVLSENASTITQGDWGKYQEGPGHFYP